jgi:hypothetical protein
MRLLAFLLFFSSYLAEKIWAYPDTIRHGYSSCTTCHVSPSGGGLMTDYGRSLSKELISSNSYNNEEAPLHGALSFFRRPKILERLVVGGDARYLHRKYDSKTSEVEEKYWMQAQLRAGLIFEKIRLIGSLGNIENPRQTDKVEWVIPEGYVIFSPEQTISLRLGRFSPIYGLRLPDHNLWVKSEAGLRPWLRQDSVEFIFENENLLTSLAGFQSTSRMPVSDQTTGYTFNIYQVIAETFRLGVSGTNSEGQGLRRRTGTLHGTLGFSKEWYVHFEILRSWTSGITKDVSFLRNGYEITKGVVPYLQFQSRVDRANVNKGQTRFGGGLLWYPRPHFEFQLQFEQQISKPVNSHEGLIIFHYYF